MSGPPVLSPAAFAARLAERASDGRIIAALAGAPGSGKSTIAAAVAAQLNAVEADFCVIVPMDGFHIDDELLKVRGWHARKGAPHTFDVGGLAAMLNRLRARREPEILFPIFDRSLEVSRGAAGVARTSARIILVEGNYLLLGAEPWCALRTSFDMTALTLCERPVLQSRLEARWLGFGFSRLEAERRVAENDLANADIVAAQSVRPDVMVNGAN